MVGLAHVDKRALFPFHVDATKLSHMLRIEFEALSGALANISASDAERCVPPPPPRRRRHPAAAATPPATALPSHAARSTVQSSTPPPSGSLLSSRRSTKRTSTRSK